MNRPKTIYLIPSAFWDTVALTAGGVVRRT